MAKSFRQIIKGLLLRGETSDPSDNLSGSLWYNSTSNRLKGYLESAIRIIVSEDQTQTLTNKTIDGDLNTVQDLPLTSLKTNLTDASKFIVRDASGIPVSNTKDVPAGVVVGTSDSQTLTNKTIVVASNVVTTAASGNLAATELNAALAELQGDIDTRATSADLSTHMSDTSTHGITSDIVGRTETQTLTNKTLVVASNTITTTASGNLAATELNAALAELQGDIDTRALDSALTTHMSDTSTHGITSDIVGRTETQTLSNKTFSDAPIIAEIATPSTPASGFGKVYFKSDGFLYQLNDDGTETKVGAGSGNINYITNSDLESNVTGYVAYADAAGVAPVDGTGGAPTVTATRSTSSPLRGSGSLLLTKDAANRQGEGISYDFTIASADKAKILQGSLEYNIGSGTYVDDDVRMYIYDVTNAVVIQPAPYLLKNHTTAGERFPFEFQTASNSTSYRLIFHVASTSASAYTLKFDTISVGPQAKLYGSPITDWVEYIPTLTGFGTPTAVKFYSRRVGDSLEVEGSWTNGTTTAVEARISLGFGGINSNVTIDTTKIKPVGNLGFAIQGAAATTIFTASVLAPTANQTYVNMGLQTSTAHANTIVAAANTFNNSVLMTVNFRAPIVGWGSSQIASQDADTRIIIAQITGDPASATIGNPIIVPTVGFDTHGAYNNSTGRYTCPVSGYYKIYGALVSASGGGIGLFIYKDAVQQTFLGNTDSNSEMTFTGLVQANAGQLIDIRPGATLDASSIVLNIEKASGPAQIMASELVEAHYNTAAAQSIDSGGSGEIVDFGTKVVDSHGAVTTGASWKFTAPKAGTYSVKAILAYNSGGGWAVGEAAYLVLYKNAVLVEYLDISYQTATHAQSVVTRGSSDIKLIAGDYISIFAVQDSGAAISLQASGNDNYVSIVSR